MSSTESKRREVAAALDSRCALRAAELLNPASGNGAGRGALFSWCNATTRSGQYEVAVALLTGSDLQPRTRDYGLSCVLNTLIRRRHQLRPALKVLAMIDSSNWDLSSGVGDILKLVVHKLGRAQMTAGPLPTLPIAVKREHEAVWREICLGLAEWGVSLLDAPAESHRLLTALLALSDSFGGYWGALVRNIVSIQSRLCDLGLDLDTSDEHTLHEGDLEDPVRLAQDRQNLAWEWARFRPPDEAVEVLETVRHEWFSGQAARFVCEEFLGRGLLDDALAVLRRFDPGSAKLVEVAERMRQGGRESEVRAILDEAAAPAASLRGLLDFPEYYPLGERDAELRLLIDQMASDSLVQLCFAYPKIVHAGYEDLFWSSLPQGRTPYHVLVSVSIELGERELLSSLILRSLNEPGWEWEMVPALTTLFPEQAREIGGFIVVRLVEDDDEDADE